MKGKKWLILLASLALVLLASGVGVTRSFLVDPESSTGNTFQAWTSGEWVQTTEDDFNAGVLYQTVDVQVGADADDGEEDGREYGTNSWKTDGYYEGENKGFFGYYETYDSPFEPGFRFDNITCSGTITNAYIELYFISEGHLGSPENPLTTTGAYLYGIDEADPATFSETDNTTWPSSRNRTTANVSWNKGYCSGWHQSPDISTIIQELVDKYTYTGTQAMSIYWREDTHTQGTYAMFELYGHDGGHTPRLHIEYTTVDTTTSSGDVKLSSSTPIAQTETLRPNAAGDECNIDREIGAACPNHYQNVDEAIADGSTTRVSTSQSFYLRDLYNIADHSVGSGTINHITVYAVAITYGSAWASLKIAIKSGTGTGAPDTVSESDEKTVTSSWASYSNQWSTNPATGSAWTWDEIDALQAGIAMRDSDDWEQTYCTQVYVEVDYVPLEYNTPGTIASQVLDTGVAGARWDALFWDEILESGTDITFEVRASDTLSGGFPDASWVPVGGVSPVTSGLPPGRYMQWRATLTTSDTSKTPTLREVRVYHY